MWILYNPIFGADGKPIRIVKFATEITKEKLRTPTSLARSPRSANRSPSSRSTWTAILNANANFQAALGYTLDEIKGKHHRMFVNPAERESEAYRAFWARLNRGEYKSGEYRRIGKGGKEIWIQASYNPILDLIGKPFKVVKNATDITQQVQARGEVAEMMASIAFGARKK